MVFDWRVPACFFVCSVLALVSCTAQVPTPPTPTISPTTTPTATPFPTRTPSIVFTPTPTPLPALHFPPTLAVLARGFGEPDDLALLLDGSILFSDTGNGTINQIARDGKVTTLLRRLKEPEGIVVRPDGAFIIAEQDTNRLLLFHPGTGQPATTWLALENKTGHAGVDGVVRDPATGDLIVSDSPNGRVLRVSVDAKNVRVIATGLVRPTGAAVAPNGDIIVADEYGDMVVLLRADGRVISLGHFSMPDDIAIDTAGNIYVASLGDNSVRMISATGGVVRLIANVRDPQGIMVDADGNLVVAEASLNRIVRLKIR